MKIFFAALLIIFLAFSGYHLTFKHFKLPLSARKFYLTGTEFLFFGLLLGPEFLNIIDIETSRGLDPFTAFLPGWIGLLFGLQFDIQRLRRFPIEFFSGAVLESLLTFIIVFTGIYILFSYIPHAPLQITFASALTLAAAAACTAPTGLALIQASSVTCCQDTVKLLQYISSIDGIIALLFFGLAFFFRPFTELSLFTFAGDIFLTLLASAGFVILFSLYLSLRRDESELILITLGMVVFMGGTAMMLDFSPLLINFFAGVYLVNFSREKNRLFNLLIGIEKPVYLLLLIFIGVSWYPGPAVLLIWAGVYCFLRASGKLMGGYMITRITPEMRKYPGHLGLGLLSPGGLPLAVLFDFQKGFPQSISQGVISLALIAVIYNDIISPHMIERLLVKEERLNRI